MARFVENWCFHCGMGRCWAVWALSFSASSGGFSYAWCVYAANTRAGLELRMPSSTTEIARPPAGNIAGVWAPTSGSSMPSSDKVPWAAPTGGEFTMLCL